MAIIDVYSPVKGFTGTSVGVAFTGGHAEVEEGSAAYKYFKRRGYRLGDAADEGNSDPDESISGEATATDGDPGRVQGPQAPADTSDPELSEIPGMPGADATRGELAEFAEGMGLETEGLTKAKILEKIKAEATTKEA